MRLAVSSQPGLTIRPSGLGHFHPVIREVFCVVIVRIVRMCFPRGSWDFGPRKSSHSLGLALPAPFLATWETYQVFLVSRWETALDFACLGLVSPLCRVNLVVSYWLIETDLVVPSVFTIGPEPHLGVRASSAGTRFRT